MQKVAIVSFSNTQSDPRVLRQIQTLSKVSDLTVYGFGARPDEKVRFISLGEDWVSPKYSLARKTIDGLLLALRLYSAYYWRTNPVKLALGKGIRRDFQIYLANDFETLPLILKMAPEGSKVYLDAHEYTPDQSPRDKWYSWMIHRYLSEWLVKKHLKRVDGMMTVAPGIAEAYSAKFGAQKPVVIMNTPNFEILSTHSTSEDRIRLIHHGIASPRRGLDLLIDLMDALDRRFELNLMLIDNGAGYLNELQSRAKLSSRSSDIHFLSPVATSQISSYINQFDLGILIYPPMTLNEKLSLPNKFFEFIQARLGVVVGPSPEMMRIVSEYKIGIVGEDFAISSLSKALNYISSKDIDEFKTNSSKAAQTYNWEINEYAIRNTLGLT